MPPEFRNEHTVSSFDGEVAIFQANAVGESSNVWKLHGDRACPFFSRVLHCLVDLIPLTRQRYIELLLSLEDTDVVIRRVIVQTRVGYCKPMPEGIKKIVPFLQESWGRHISYQRSWHPSTSKVPVSLPGLIHHVCQEFSIGGFQPIKGVQIPPSTRLLFHTSIKTASHFHQVLMRLPLLHGWHFIGCPFD